MYLSTEDFADTRQKAVKDSLESKELAALLVEKFAEGMQSCGRDEVHKAARLCESIDPDYKQNRRLRYERVAKLDLTQPC